MIYIVHGEDTVKSRTLLVNQQKKLEVETKIELDISEISPQDLFDRVAQQDMFGNKQFIVLNVPNSQTTVSENFIEIINKTPKETTLVIYSETTLSRRSVFIKHAKKLAARVIENEQKPQGNVFKFTDNIFYKNRVQTYKELETLLNEGEDEFRLFSSLLYGLRNITYFLYECDLYNKLRSFQKDKIKRQAKNFSKNNIKHIYQELYTIEKMAKTGKISPEIMLVRSIEKILNS